MDRIRSHFSRIAHRYEDLRTTDVEPIYYIKKELQNLNRIEGADVGCGVGRYVIKLFQHLGEKLHLICIDYNRRMLKEVSRSLKRHKITKFKTINALAEALPLSNSSLDIIVTFNAIHHFNLPDFLGEASRTLSDDGCLFTYTRLRSQNKRSIWGRFFPEFHEKERRLYELSDLEGMVKNIHMLQLESIEYFKYRRRATLEWLTKQALHQHYSTFCLYDEIEFKEAFCEFQENITCHFKNSNNIIWDDENIMLKIRKSIQ